MIGMLRTKNHRDFLRAPCRGSMRGTSPIWGSNGARARDPAKVIFACGRRGQLPRRRGRPMRRVPRRCSPRTACSCWDRFSPSVPCCASSTPSCDRLPEMDRQLKQRVVGAAVLVALGVIFIPLLLDQGRLETSSPELPTVPPVPSVVAEATLDLPPIDDAEIEALEQLSEQRVEIPAPDTAVPMHPKRPAAGPRCAAGTAADGPGTPADTPPRHRPRRRRAPAPPHRRNRRPASPATAQQAQPARASGVAGRAWRDQRLAGPSRQFQPVRQCRRPAKACATGFRRSWKPATSTAARPTGARRTTSDRAAAEALRAELARRSACRASCSTNREARATSFAVLLQRRLYTPRPLLRPAKL